MLCKHGVELTKSFSEGPAVRKFMPLRHVSAKQEIVMNTLNGKTAPRHRRLARHRPRQRPRTRRRRCAGPGAFLEFRRRGRRRRCRNPRRRRPGAESRRGSGAERGSAAPCPAGARHRRRPARHPGRECRHLQGSYHRGHSVDDFDRLFAVNVRAPFFLVQQLLPILRDGSSVTFLGSLAARAAVGNISPMPPPRARSTPWSRISRQRWGRGASA